AQGDDKPVEAVKAEEKPAEKTAPKAKEKIKK
ncbi:uncharacterized protein METZ01_LOCUS504441, partial [marine metagenome]